MPPTFIIGIKVIAITIIPIPPNHWSIALHNRIPFGVFSKSEIIVDPVVVIPDILSKKASVIERLKKELDYNINFLSSVENKLKNKSFVDNAPKDIVDKEKKKVNDANKKIEAIKKALSDLG